LFRSIKFDTKVRQGVGGYFVVWLKLTLLKRSLIPEAMLPDWQAIEYLQAGSPAQQAAYHTLQRHAILPLLQAYTPILVGTFPLNIAIASNDLDIICEVHDFPAFSQLVAQHFGHCPAYTTRQIQVGGVASLVISFRLDEMEVEVFGQPLASKQQNGYRHLVVEARLLALGGAAFKQAVIDLKTQGLKTEPAFATLLALPGDAYQALLHLESATDAELASLLPQC
jgi:hypothetical protein